MKRFGVGVVVYMLLLSTAAISCGRESHGGAGKGDDPGKAPPSISEAGDSFLKEAEARLNELKERAERVENDLRKSAGMAEARREFDEARKRLADMERDLDELKALGNEAAAALRDELERKEEEFEIFLNRAARDGGS